MTDFSLQDAAALANLIYLSVLFYDRRKNKGAEASPPTAALVAVEENIYIWHFRPKLAFEMIAVASVAVRIADIHIAHKFGSTWNHLVYREIIS